MEFEKLYNKAKRFKMEQPPPVRSNCWRAPSWIFTTQLIFTGVDYAEEGTLFEQMKSALLKFFVQQVKPVNSSTNAIKMEEFCAEDEEVEEEVE